MAWLLLENADVLVTMNETRDEIPQASVLIHDNVIEKVGSAEEVRQFITKQNLDISRRIDLSGCVLVPGLVNCHHHLYQTLTRTIGTAEGKSLFDWLTMLYPIWAQMDAAAVYTSAKLGLTACGAYASRQGLVEMMVTVDETGNQHAAMQIKPTINVQVLLRYELPDLFHTASFFNDIVANEYRRLRHFITRFVHGDQHVGVLEQQPGH